MSRDRPFPRFRRGLVGQTVILATIQHGTQPAEIKRVGYRFDGRPQVLLLRLVADPAPRVDDGGVTFPAEAVWLTGHDACRSFLTS